MIDFTLTCKAGNLVSVPNRQEKTLETERSHTCGYSFSEENVVNTATFITNSSDCTEALSQESCSPESRELIPTISIATAYRTSMVLPGKHHRPQRSSTLSYLVLRPYGFHGPIPFQLI
ncbi:hypothetical protein ElyMa_000731900 [Elysia marginata]|uniref:Uncharacterized protein n=1 Tax=Elysia marginata TaxID=1093978 RepID=A0AAV4GN09_9GAST|nr:hypothetical protein ElyMa_000731900 [Elysia marginata]